MKRYVNIAIRSDREAKFLADTYPFAHGYLLSEGRGYHVRLSPEQEEAAIAALRQFRLDGRSQLYGRTIAAP